MVLATHAIVGGAAASLFPSHPTVAFFAGFFSHFVLDAIPHWQYAFLSSKVKDPSTVKVDKYYVWDLFRIGLDVTLGVVATILIVWYPISNMLPPNIVMLGMIGGVLPDFLQFVYSRFPSRPMSLVQRFHDLMHTKCELPVGAILGVFLQVAIIAFVILSAKYLVQL
jgi:hypothetical protein